APGAAPPPQAASKPLAAVRPARRRKSRRESGDDAMQDPPPMLMRPSGARAPTARARPISADARLLRDADPEQQASLLDRRAGDGEEHHPADRGDDLLQ